MNGLSGIEQAALTPGYPGTVQPAQDFAQELHKQANDHAPPHKSVPNLANHVAQGASTPATSTASAMTQAATTDAASTLVQRDGVATSTQAVSPVTPIGITEAFLGARVFGLHLSAQGYLSELGALDLPGETKQEGVTAVSSSHKAANIAGAAAEEFATTLTPSATAGGVANTVVAGPVSVADVSAGRVELVHNVDAAASIAVAASDEAVQWSERALRFSRDGGKGVTAWLRDYRLKESELGQVLGSLTAHTREQGMTLQRIVLNGREVWTSSAHPQGSDYAG
jgi:hypothetical protein